MSSIRVDWQRAASVQDSLAGHRRELSSTIASIRGIKSYRCITGGGFDATYRALDRAISRLENEKTGLSNLEKGLGNILDVYKKAEAGAVWGGKPMVVPGFFKTPDWLYPPSPSPSIEIDWSLLWKLIKELGIGGKAISCVGRLITCEWNEKNIAEAIKTALSAIGKVASTAAKGAEANWFQAMFGLEPFDTSTSVLAKEWSDLSLKGAATVGDTVKVVTKWGENVLTFFIHYLENQEEFQNAEALKERMVGETIVESVTDIFLGYLAKTASAEIVASFCANPLTLAVAVGAIVIKGAADVGCKWATGKDIAETLADWICDRMGLPNGGSYMRTEWERTLPSSFKPIPRAIVST